MLRSFPINAFLCRSVLSYFHSFLILFIMNNFFDFKPWLKLSSCMSNRITTRQAFEKIESHIKSNKRMLSFQKTVNTLIYVLKRLWWKGIKTKAAFTGMDGSCLETLSWWHLLSLILLIISLKIVCLNVFVFNVTSLGFEYHCTKKYKSFLFQQ